MGVRNDDLGEITIQVIRGLNERPPVCLKLYSHRTTITTRPHPQGSRKVCIFLKLFMKWLVVKVLRNINVSEALAATLIIQFRAVLPTFWLRYRHKYTLRSSNRCFVARLEYEILLLLLYHKLECRTTNLIAYGHEFWKEKTDCSSPIM